jgi:hypothetical protein
VAAGCLPSGAVEVARRWNDAAVALERRPKHRLFGDGLGAGARALKVEGTSLAVFFHHDGMSPQRIGTRAGPSTVGSTASMVMVGATRTYDELPQPVSNSGAGQFSRALALSPIRSGTTPMKTAVAGGDSAFQVPRRRPARSWLPSPQPFRNDC